MTEIGLLAYPGSLLGGIYGITDLFGVADEKCAEHGTPGFRLTHWRQREGQVIQDFESSPGQGRPLQAVIVPGTMEGVPPFADMDPCLAWLRQMHGQGTTVCSVCAGAFVLAAAGLLDGRRATTHWQFASLLAQMYPAVEVDSGHLIIEDGDIATAGGVMAWIDLALRLVHRFAGATVMLETARFFLVDPPGREQRFYSTFTPNLSHGDDLVLRIQHWLQQSYAQPHRVADLAERAQLGERSFLRRFQKATGLGPTEYVQRLRVGKAREALEFSQDTVNEIAWKVGYEDPAAFRKVFRRLIGLSPRDYRQRFRPEVLSTH